MFEYFILVYFLSHKLAHAVKDDFRRFVHRHAYFKVFEVGIFVLIFFGLHSRAGALAGIVFFWLVIIATIVELNTSFRRFKFGQIGEHMGLSI